MSLNLNEIFKMKIVELTDKEVEWFKVIFRHIRKQGVINSAFGDDSNTAYDTFYDIQKKIYPRYKKLV